jgi:hypothetical protein
MKKLTVGLLSALMGILFILSAYFKLWPIEPFEYKIVGTSFFGWQSSVFVARIIIGIECAIGLLLLFSYKLQTTIKMTLALLVFFSVHLVYLIFWGHATADCGCMGSLLTLTPLQGLLKNIGMIVVCLLIYRMRFDFEWKRFPHLEFYILLISTALVFIVNPVDLEHSETYLNRPFETFELNVDTVYTAPPSESVEHPVVDIRDKKYVLSFLSASCPHCRIAARKISVISAKNPAIPFYFFINGDSPDIKIFLEETETAHIPHSRLGRDLFIPLAGLQLPVIYYYNQGKIDRKVDYYTLEQYHIEQWMKGN